MIDHSTNHLDHHEELLVVVCVNKAHKTSPLTHGWMKRWYVDRCKVQTLLLKAHLASTHASQWHCHDFLPLNLCMAAAE
jgi:hypothetical protein